MDRSIESGNHRNVARIGVKIAGNLLGIDPIVSGIEALAKGYQVGKEYGYTEGLKAVALSLGTNVAAGSIAEGFTSGLSSDSLLNEDQRRIVTASVSVALEEILEPFADMSEGWR